MAIHAVKVEDFHSKLTSCSACRLAGRMAIHAVKVEDFHSNEISNVVNYRLILCRNGGFSIYGIY